MQRIAVSARISVNDWKLVEELYPRLRRFAAVVASWDLDPDDVLQEALVRVLSRRELSSLDHPAAYIRKAMTNVVRDEQRRLRSQAQTMVVIGDPEFATDTYPSDLDGLTKLTPQGRAALFLAEVEGFTYSEIGDVLGCSEVAARMAAMRARRHLRSHVASEAQS